jgi:hypothetical protein
MQSVIEDKFASAKENARGWLSSIEDMLETYNDANDDTAAHGLADEARETIEQSVLSVMVRDGWRSPGVPAEGADEYEILLSTGGPALRIWGQLDQFDEPRSAELQMQDWFLPWTRFPAAEKTLLQFARCFYFGG